MAKTDAVHLQHMIDAACKVVAFTQGRKREDLDQNEMLALAVVRLIEILEEAAKNISEHTNDSNRDINSRSCLTFVSRCFKLPIFHVNNLVSNIENTIVVSHN